MMVSKTATGMMIATSNDQMVAPLASNRLWYSRPGSIQIEYWRTHDSGRAINARRLGFPVVAQVAEEAELTTVDAQETVGGQRQGLLQHPQPQGIGPRSGPSATVSTPDTTNPHSVMARLMIDLSPAARLTTFPGVGRLP